MRIVKLTEKDFQRIKEFALTNWLNKGERGDLNVCKAYVDAYTSYLKSRNLILKDGVIYEKTDSK